MARKAKAKKVFYSAAELAAMDPSDAFEAKLVMRSAARQVYSEVLAKCEAAQAAYPKLYLLDECISRENASDGLFSNEGRKMSGDEYNWGVEEYDYMARNLENDTAVRMAEAGLDPSEFGLRY